MAIYAITTEGEEALAAATAETLLQIRGSTITRARLLTWSVSFDGTTATNEPVLVELVRQSTDGTATGATEIAFDPVDPAAQCTGFHSFTAEPTVSATLEQHNIHPMGGILVREYPPGREPVVDDATTSRLAIRITAPNVVNAVGFMHWEE